MRKKSLTIIFLLLCSLMSVAQTLYVGSYNIRYQNSEDTGKGNGWEQRCPVVCDQLNFEHPDIFGAQEVLEPQLHDMLKRLDGYSYIGVGRDDGKTKGEYAAVFYDRNKLQLLDSGHFWLSQTPDKPSLGWDAACIRICTWGRFEDKVTGFRFLFLNLHMDHVGVTARRESAQLVIREIRKMANKTCPVVLTGDFNVDQDDEIYRIFSQSGMLSDCYTQARLRFAENGTFNAYHQERKTGSRIDHVFVSPHFSVDRYGILTNTYWADQRRLPSDHYPVFVRLNLVPGSGLRVQDSSLFPLTSNVNPHIGTGGHGHVFLGANVPFGFVQLGPTNRTEGWDWCSGYHYSDSLIIGFSHLHLSGTGVGDLGDIALLPVLDAEQRSVTFSHKAEYARPGYYSVMLDNGIRAELTATERTGMHRYTLPADASEGLLRLDLQQGIGWDKTTECEARQETATVISGYRHSKGWAKRQKLFFVVEFSRPVEICREDSSVKVLRFSADDEPLTVRVGLSAVSIDGARANLRAEQQGRSFRSIATEAGRKWEEQLEKIQVKGGTDDERTIFYTAMYHTMTAPSVFCDVDGRYRGADGEVHQPSTVNSRLSTNYTTFSLWDTYRAAHPLMTLIHTDRLEDIATTMLNIWREQGKLPVWHLMGCETDCMVGNPAIPVLADLVLKGLTTQSAQIYEAMKASAMLDERGLSLLKQYGYIPCDLYKDNETVGRGMEYAIADWCVARVAEKLGKKADRKYFDRRAQSYRKYFDPATGFMRGLDSKGRFSFSQPSTKFNPFHSAPQNRDYTEGNAWQYTWLVPHDVRGLMSLFGSEQRFVSKLDSLFIVTGDLGEGAPPDISGLIGQYAHGNEPSHHVLYLYNYVGQPWKGARLIRRTMRELYHNAPDGLSGNEDVGQMSAWYILSAMGLYQVEPAGGKYMFGSPLFPEVTMKVADKTFTIKAHNVSDENIYIQSVRLNGKPYTRSYIMYDDIMRGGMLEFEMGSATPETSKAERQETDSVLFRSQVIDKKIQEVKRLLSGNPRLAWMFGNCFPNTLETTVHYRVVDGEDDTFVYTGDIHAMWLRDSGAQVWPYVRFANQDAALHKMLRGVILRQWKCINTDPYANAFNDGPTGGEWQTDMTDMKPELHERKYEIDSECYPIRLAYEYWQVTGDGSVFGDEWLQAVANILRTFREQQRKDGVGPYRFMRKTERAYDTLGWNGYGAPARPVGLIASSFRPSDDATTLPFLIPSNFMAVTSLRKASEILTKVNHNTQLASECASLADEVEAALREHAVVRHPKYGMIYAFETDGFGNHLLMDDANVPSLLAMGYLGDVAMNDSIYLNTRRFVWSEDNPWFFSGKAGEGVGGPHVGYDMVWPMSIMMKCFTAQDDDEIRYCMRMLLNTDAGTGFMHESFHKDDASRFTRAWFAWQNTLFGELVLKLIDDGKTELLNTL